MKVLIVGCGAVGQVFGYALHKAGVDLAFYARTGSAGRLAQALEGGGLPLFQTSYSRRRNPIAQRLENYRVVTDIAESQAFQPDQIWFTTPSTVYYSDWYREFLQQVPSARVVCFAPEGARPEFTPPGVDADRMVFGGITLIAWQGNLAGGGGRPEGVNYWLPPLLGIPLMGSEPACRAVGDLLKKGGLRWARQKPEFGPSLAAVTAVMLAFVAGLELAGWSLKAYRASPWLRRAAYGTQQAVLTQLTRPGCITRELLKLFFSPAGLSLTTFLLPLLFPFDIEKYLKFHYLKTREQTLAVLDVFAHDGEKRGMEVENIRAMLQGLN